MAKATTLEESIESFDEIGRLWIGDATEVNPSDVPDILYHYTDAAGLYGMLTSGKIWLTDYRFLNDKTEIIHTFNVAKKVIENGMKDEQDSGLLSFYTDVLSIMERDLEYPSLVFSLSEDADDLSQWRGYARDGRGFTIGFDGRKLHRASTGPSGEFQFSRVEYDQIKQTNGLTRALSEMEDQLKTEIAKNNDKLEDLTWEAARSFYWIVNNRGTINKHSSFKAEKEWRILQYIGKAGLDLKVRVGGDRLIPYSELCPCPDDDRLPIKRIGIGPSLAGKIDAQSIKILCEQTGYDLDVYFADAPYRGFY